MAFKSCTARILSSMAVTAFSCFNCGIFSFNSFCFHCLVYRLVPYSLKNLILSEVYFFWCVSTQSNSGLVDWNCLAIASIVSTTLFFHFRRNLDSNVTLTSLWKVCFGRICINQTTWTIIHVSCVWSTLFTKEKHNWLVLLVGSISIYDEFDRCMCMFWGSITWYIV